MRKIFVFWIIFLIMLTIGIGLTIYSKSALRREEKKAAELKGLSLPRPSRIPKTPAVSEAVGETKEVQPEAEVEPQPKAEEEAAKDTPLPATPELPPLQNIPVEINTNSLEISVPASSEQLPSLPQSEEPAQ